MGLGSNLMVSLLKLLPPRLGLPLDLDLYNVVVLAFCCTSCNCVIVPKILFSLIKEPTTAGSLV